MPIRKPRTKKEKKKAVKTVMHEFKSGALHSGSKKGPLVTNRKQAIAIALSESDQSKSPKKKRNRSGKRKTKKKISHKKKEEK